VIGGVAVGDGDEFLDPPCPGVLHRKELLVFLHRGLQNLRRQFDEVVGNVAQQHHRPFHQPGDLGQKPGVLHHLEAQREGLLRGVVADGFGPLGRVEHHFRRLQLRHVVLERRHLDLARSHEPMPARGIARADTVDLQRHHLRPVLIGEDAQDRVQGPHPAQSARPPAHRLRPREIAHRGLQHLRHDLGRRAALVLDGREPDRALRRLTRLELVAGKPRAAQEAFDCLLRRAHLRPLALLARVRAHRGQPLQREREAARRGKGGGTGIGQPRLHQPVGHELPEVFRRPGLHPRRDFFREEFDQEIHAVSPDIFR